MSDEQGDAVETRQADGDSPGEESDGGDDAGGGVGSLVADGEYDIEELAAAIDEADPDEVAETVAALDETVDDLESSLEETTAERDDLEERLKRKQAEFQNYKKRQEKRREKERARATEELVEELLDVRDNLDRALAQDDDADIRDGVEVTFRGLDDVLESEGVEAIDPSPGDAVDPARHEVLLRVDSDQPGGTVAGVHRPGYEMAGKVIRPAQVVVSDGPESGEDSESD
jgi:molecular chaperone GrpE